VPAGRRKGCLNDESGGADSAAHRQHRRACLRVPACVSARAGAQAGQRRKPCSNIKKHLCKPDPLPEHIPNVPTLSAEAVKTVLDQLGEKDPRARAAKPEQFLEPRFMDELEKEGFIQRLWR